MQLLKISLILAVIHSIDHILRIDHSGWPFIKPTSPFTFSLLVFPVFALIFLVSKPWFRIVGTGCLFLAATLAHIFFEPLRDKFHTWTYKSDLPGHVNEENLLGINSPILGIISIAIAVLLSLTLLLSFISFIKESRNKSHAGNI